MDDGLVNDRPHGGIGITTAHAYRKAGVSRKLHAWSCAVLNSLQS